MKGRVGSSRRVRGAGLSGAWGRGGWGQEGLIGGSRQMLAPQTPVVQQHAHEGPC